MKAQLMQLTKKGLKFAAKNSPSILSGLGAAGVVSTTMMAIKATPSAMAELDYADRKKGAPLTTFEKIKVVVPEYIPTIAMGSVTIGCIIGANSVNLKRNAALASMYSFTDATLRDYQKKVKEVIGEKKEKGIRDEMAADKVAVNPPKDINVINTGDGETLCYDSWTGRYFKSDIEKIKRIENEINARLLRDDFISLNEVYYELNLGEVKLGEEVGWKIMDSLVYFDYSSTLTPEGVPCLVIDFKVSPQYDFMD